MQAAGQGGGAGEVRSPGAPFTDDALRNALADFVRELDSTPVSALTKLIGQIRREGRIKTVMQELTYRPARITQCFRSFTLASDRGCRAVEALARVYRRPVYG